MPVPWPAATGGRDANTVVARLVPPSASDDVDALASRGLFRALNTSSAGSSARTSKSAGASSSSGTSTSASTGTGSDETNDADQQRVCVAVRLLGDAHALQEHAWGDGGPEWMVMWARCTNGSGGSDPGDDHDDGGKTLSLPLSMLRSIQRTLLDRAPSEGVDLEVRPHPVISLSKCFLEALDDAAFRHAEQSAEELEAVLDGRVARQGSTLSLRSPAPDQKELRYRIVVTEPVLQGVIAVADDGPTEIMVTSRDGPSRIQERPEAATTKRANGANGVANGHSASSGHMDFGDDVDIDERYLAQAVLDGFGNLDGDSSDPGAAISSPAFAPDATGGAPWARTELCTVRCLQDRSVATHAISAWRRNRLEARNAERAESPATANGLASHSTSDGNDDDEWQEGLVDEESVVLLDDLALAEVGAFEGDWAVAELRGHPDRSRVARLFALPSHLARSRSRIGSETQPQAHVPPMLLQNLHTASNFDSAHFDSGELVLRPLVSVASTTDPSSYMPPLPFADAITISRVASPLSINRAYQPLFFEALRRYFESSRRIVREGDVLCVGIQGERVRWVRREEGETGAPTSTSTGPEDSLSFELPSAPDGAREAETPTSLVYFLISSLTPELSEPPMSTLATAGRRGGDASHAKDPKPAEIALQEKLRNGSLGCVVEPSLSKMVQAGVDCLKVCDASRWLQVATDTPPLPRTCPALTSASSPYGKLLSLMRATFQPQASRYGLHLTALLQGGRGTGKRTVARWVAESVGAHLVEIDCFSLVSDADARTEGVLRARLSQAASCAPAVVLLRHVEALARKSQAAETGQEPVMAGVLRDCLEALRSEVEENAKKQRHKARESGGAIADGEKQLNGDGGEPQDDGSRRASLDAERQLPVAVFATTSEAEKCPSGLLGCFKHEVIFQVPNETERHQMLQIAAAEDVLSPDVNLKSVATQTAALVAADLVDLMARARLASLERLHKSPSFPVGLTPSHLRVAGVVVSGADLDAALAKARGNYSESIGAPKIPNVTWDDVGGLASVKEDILDTIQLPLEHPELFSDGVKKRSGILLYGPPGTGKTLLAKAVATSCSLNFFSVKGPELLNMYIGESEANVRRVFQRARDAKPCVIFFDELDSVAPKRGNQGDSGGVMDRIVSQLLAELDGMAGGEGGADVFVIGATNRPDLLDPALLRPGRFDRMLYLSVSETHAAQLNILQALTRKFQLDPDVGDLSVVAEQCPFNLTGADFYALCSDAMLKAMTRKAAEVDEKIAEINASPPGSHPELPTPLTPQYYLAEVAKPHEVEVRVALRDFESALAELVPSVSEDEMAHYRQVQAKFSQPSKKPRPGEDKPPPPPPPQQLLEPTEQAPLAPPAPAKGAGLDDDVAPYDFRHSPGEWAPPTLMPAQTPPPPPPPARTDAPRSSSASASVGTGTGTATGVDRAEGGHADGDESEPDRHARDEGKGKGRAKGKGKGKAPALDD